MDLQKEKSDLIQTVDRFANEMRARLLEKAEQGKAGWRGEYPTDKLWMEISEDAWRADPTRAVDVANRAMIIWFRSQGKRRGLGVRCGAR